MRRSWGVTALHVAALAALLLALSAALAMAADHSPWVNRLSKADTLIELAQRQDACCKHCTKGQPCGNSCISTRKKCRTAPGCAC